MAAHHIAVDAAVLGVEKKHVRIVINAATTAMDVVRSVVKECALSTMPGQYSLWMLINIGKGNYPFIITALRLYFCILFCK